MLIPRAFKIKPVLFEEAILVANRNKKSIHLIILREEHGGGVEKQVSHVWSFATD